MTTKATTFAAMLTAALGATPLRAIERTSGVPNGSISLFRRGLRFPEPRTLAALCRALPGLEFDAASVAIARERRKRGGRKGRTAPTTTATGTTAPLVD